MKDWPDTIDARNAGAVAGFYSPDTPLEQREPFVDQPAIDARAAAGAPAGLTSADVEQIRARARAEVLAEYKSLLGDHEPDKTPAKKATAAKKAR